MILWWVWLAAAGPVSGWAAEAGAAGGEEHGLPQHAVKLTSGSFAITNSMVVTWIVALGLILFAQVATRRMKEVPDGAQNFWEWMVESLHDFLEGIIGQHLVNRTFWFSQTFRISDLDRPPPAASTLSTFPFAMLSSVF